MFPAANKQPPPYTPDGQAGGPPGSAAPPRFPPGTPVGDPAALRFPGPPGSIPQQRMPGAAEGPRMPPGTPGALPPGQQFPHGVFPGSTDQAQPRPMFTSQHSQPGKIYLTFQFQEQYSFQEHVNVQE